MANPDAGDISSEDVQMRAGTEAALALLESLILVLVEKRTNDKALMSKALGDAIDTQRQQQLNGSDPRIAAAATRILSRISNSVLASRGPHPSLKRRKPRSRHRPG